MVSPRADARAGELKPSPNKLANIFHRHQLKFLNSSLVIYLCLGVFLFELIGEFSGDILAATGNNKDLSRQNDSETKKVSRGSTLGELRELSARRMWNITNRLNILYESNWTRLMLDELQEFERQLLGKLMEEATLNQKGEQDDEGDDDEDPSRRKSKSRIRSLKKSLIHSLSTITTVGFSEDIRSSAGKLATVMYGLIGIPLLFCSVTQTGKQVAHSALNGLLIIRHYCFSLPVHYLCCSCSLMSCFRCLLWCCCCCCCSYLCCCLNNDKGKNKRCDSSRAPKLKLRKRRKAGSLRSQLRDGVTRCSPDERQTAFVIGTTIKDDRLSETPPSREFQQKSVRFKKSAKSERLNYDEEDDYEDDDMYYTQSVFLTSLTALSFYLLLGAYIYSNYTNSSLIDALFVCYSMLSTSKLPGQTSETDQIHSDPQTLYQQLNATSSNGSKTPARTTESIESEVIKWIYLLIGLNLVSACGHFAKLWLSNELKLDGCPASSQSKKYPPAFCNGQVIDSIESSYQSPADDPNQKAASVPAMADALQVAANIGQVMSSVDYNNLASHKHNIYQQHNEPQVNLNGLFLLPNPDQSTPTEMHFVSSQNQQHSTGPTDISLTSDRSTDRGSLCHHHQLQHQSSRPNSNEPSLYSHSVYSSNNPMKRHHRYPSQSHLYLPPLAAQQLTDQYIVDCEEADEMDVMLRSCINGDRSSSSKLRSSSSSTHLSHQNGPVELHQPVSGAINKNSSGAQSQVAFDKQNGQDSSLNTINDGSNTISSSNSSRTVKLPQMRPNQQIGFILASEHQPVINKHQK